jgi:hypothetical protein
VAASPARTVVEMVVAERALSRLTAFMTLATCPPTTPASMSPPTRMRASRWDGPEKGTGEGTPWCLTVENNSTIRQVTN